MDKPSRFRFYKLSATKPNFSLFSTLRKLAELQKLVQQSNDIESGLGNIVRNLRKAMAPEGQPFIFTTEIKTNEQLIRSTFSSLFAPL